MTAGRRPPAGAPRARPGVWICYVLECADGTLYTGITTSLERRLGMHDGGQASRYTRARRPVRLAYAEALATRSDASRRELEVKRMSRARKLALLAGPRLTAPGR